MERGFLINNNWNWKEDNADRSDARITSNTKLDQGIRATITLEITRTKKTPVKGFTLRKLLKLKHNDFNSSKS